MARPDFTGYATKYGVRCSDGRTIRHNAFADCDGKQVPIVWEHNHNSPDNVIGHGILKHCDDGVKIAGYFNDSYYGEQAKKVVKHGDINSLSICANHVVEKDKNVMHGNIKEVSLVLCGANPEAVIENITIAHSDGSLETIVDEAIIVNTPDDAAFSIEQSDEAEEEKFNEVISELEHSEKEAADEAKFNEIISELEHSDNKTVGDIFNAMTEDQKTATLYLIAKAAETAESGSDVEQSDDDEEDYGFEHSDELTVGKIFESMSEEQQNVVLYLMSKAAEDAKNINHSDMEEKSMKYNAFEANNNEAQEVEFTHSDANNIIESAKKDGMSLKDAMIMHGDEDYGITDIGYLFPDEQLVDKKIEMLRNNPTDWVAKVMSGIHKSPFSRIKMMYADITPDTARAKGYVKGTRKIPEVIALFKRVISPTTIYKLQKLDRDDIIDVTTIDVVAWIKAEMRIMIEEEIARAILTGDQRDPLAAAREDGGTDKIDETKIVPIIKDYVEDVYAMRKFYTLGADDDVYSRFIDEVVLAMVDYEGSGSPTLFAEPGTVAHCLLLKDGIGNRLYKTRAELASAMGVKEIVEVPYMKDRTYTPYGTSDTVHTMYVPTTGTPANPGATNFLCRGIVVNLSDYTYGADKGGALNMFDDFDIDFNQYKYLIETRASGCLTKPHSALLVGEVVSE